jgi:DnaJ-class molecular chaperone
LSEALALLGLTDAASPEEVRLAYRIRARGAHPDAGGSVVDFLALNTAYAEALAQQKQAPCLTCRGTGRLPQAQGFYSITTDCPACGKTGRRFPSK